MPIVLRNYSCFGHGLKICICFGYFFRLLFYYFFHRLILIDFSLTVKAATLIFISGRGSASSSAKEGKPGCIYNLVKNK